MPSQEEAEHQVLDQLFHDSYHLFSFLSFQLTFLELDLRKPGRALAELHDIRSNLKKLKDLFNLLRLYYQSPRKDGKSHLADTIDVAGRLAFEAENHRQPHFTVKMQDPLFMQTGNRKKLIGALGLLFRNGLDEVSPESSWQIQVETSHADGRTTIRITDNLPRVVDRTIFLPGYFAKPGRMGLFVAKGIIEEEFSGSLYLKYSTGKETCFELILLH